MGKLKASSLISTASSNSWDPIPVTADNYYPAAKACFTTRGTAFLAALANGKWQGVEYSYSAKQWGAWLAFFKRANIPHATMLTREFYQVPTEWPHEFARDATVQQDYEAGAEFERRFLQAKNERPELLTSERLHQHKPPRSTEAVMPYRPFPALCEAFARDGEAFQRLESGLTFEVLSEIYFTATRHGQAAARDKLMRMYPPAMPASVDKVLQSFPRDPRRPKTPLDHLTTDAAPGFGAPDIRGRPFPEHLLDGV